MKTITTFIILIALFTSLTSSGQKYNLNPQKAKIAWIGYGELGTFKQAGSIHVKNGILFQKNGVIESAEVIIDMKTIYHSDKSLAKHLSDRDFFWSSKYPTARLKMTSIKDEEVIADLTIRGLTRSIQFPIQIEKIGESILIKGSMTIDRTAYDIHYNSSSFFQNLGNYAIKNEFDLKFEVVFE